MSRSGWVVKVIGVRALVSALIVSAVALLAAATPAVAIKPQFEMTKPHVAPTQIGLGVLADGTLEVESAHGSLRLSPAISPPSQRAWRLSDDPAPMVHGRVVGNEVFIDQVVLGFIPVREGAHGEPARDPGVVTMVVVPNDPGEPCGSGRGSPATAEIAYDDGDGRVEVFTSTVRMACRALGQSVTMTAIALAESGGDN